MAADTGPRTPELPRELPLVGRKDELDHLYRIFGHPTRVEPMVLLTGDAGVGKTRMAEAVASEAGRRGWTVAAGRAYPVESGMPYNVLSDAFLPILKELDEAALTVLTRGTSGDLRQLFPALGSADEVVEGWDPGESRTRLFWSFTEFLKRFAERAPLLIVVEDLQWADASSLSLLHFVTRQLQGESIRILGTASRSYGRDTESLDHLERSLASLGSLRRHELPPLSREATEELLSIVFQVGGSPLRDFSAHLYGWTHGNPYFLEETLKALVRTGRLYWRDGTWLGWDVQDLDLPVSVRDALLLRLRTLSPAARSLADLISVSGGRAPVRLIGRVAELGGGELMDAVEELTGQAVAEEEEEGEVFLELRHPMVGETLYQDLGASRRRLLHCRLAESLEEMHRGRPVPVDQLAYHFTRGGDSGVDPRAVRYLAEAGRSALRRHADREAVAYLDSALDRYPEPGAVDRSDLAPGPALQAELARGLARLGRYDDAAELWVELLDRARATDDTRAAAEALRHLGLVAFWRGRHETSLEHYEASLNAIRGQGHRALEARVFLARGVTLQELGRADEARECIEESLERARALDDPTLLGRAHRALALLHTWIGNVDEARKHGWQAVELADRAGDPYVRFWGRWALASLEGLTGDTGEMKRLMAQARQVAEELRSPVLRLWTAELEVQYAYATGDWDGALAQGERAINLATSLSQTGLLPRLLVWTALVYLGRGDLPRARTMVERAWAHAGLDDDDDGKWGDVHVVVPAHIGRAACLLAEERYGEAVAVGQAGVDLADRAGYVFWSLHLLLPILAEAHLRRRDLESATAVGRRLREAGAAIGHRLATAWADACEAVVLWISGDVERGLTMLQEAADAMDRIPMTYEAARIRRQVAGRLADLGREDEALAELRDVHAVFGELGAEPELERCRGMFRELDARLPSRTEARGTPELTPREWEVAQHVAARLSNKAVAKELGISPRTVTTHVSNIYRKLGIGSRGALVDLVREGRLPARRESEF